MGRLIKRQEAVLLIAENARVSAATADSWMKDFTRINRKTGKAQLCIRHPEGSHKRRYDEDEVLSVTRAQFRKGGDGTWIPLRLAVLELNRRGFGGTSRLTDAQNYLRTAMSSSKPEKRVRWRTRLKRLAGPTSGAGRTERVIHPGDFEKLIARRKRELLEKLKDVSHRTAHDALSFLQTGNPD
jgi:hypothetical protein